MKTINGNKSGMTKVLKLTKTRLSQTDDISEDIRMYIKLKDLKAAYESGAPELLGYFTFPENGGTSAYKLILWPERNQIGCCTFEPSVFEQILRAAGIKIKATKKSKQ